MPNVNDVTESIDVGVPVTTAYNQWTQFESFPQFMEGVESVVQKTDTLTHWKVRIAGVTKEFDAQVTEQTPDQRIAWKSEDGSHAGVVTFHKIDDGTTRVTLQLDTEPSGLVEQVGDKLGLVRRRASGDLERFKSFVESRGTETGAWRGDVPRD